MFKTEPNNPELSDKFIKAKLALTPGSWFGEKGSHFYRMNFAVPLSQLKASMLALKVAVEKR